MIPLAILATIMIGIFGGGFGYEMNLPEIGPVLSVATMGGFILAAIKKDKPKD